MGLIWGTGLASLAGPNRVLTGLEEEGCRMKTALVTPTTVVPHGVTKTSSRREEQQEEEEGTWTILPHLVLLLFPPLPRLMNVFSRVACGVPPPPPLRWRRGSNLQHFTIPKSPIFFPGLRRALPVAAASLLPTSTPTSTRPPGQPCRAGRPLQPATAFHYIRPSLQRPHSPLTPPPAPPRRSHP